MNANGRISRSLILRAARHAEGLVGARRPAATDAEIEAPLAQVVERADFAGETKGMVEREQLNGRARAQTPRPPHNPARHQQWARQHGTRRIKEHLRQPHHVEPPRLRGICHLQHLAERAALIDPSPRLLKKHAEVHQAPLTLSRNSDGSNHRTHRPWRRPYAHYWSR